MPPPQRIFRTPTVVFLFQELMLVRKDYEMGVTSVDFFLLLMYSMLELFCLRSDKDIEKQASMNPFKGSLVYLHQTLLSCFGPNI